MKSKVPRNYMWRRLPHEKWEELESGRACGIDIDGVLNNYPKCWVDYINKKLHTSFDNLIDVKKKISHYQYTELKKEYRQSEYKAKIIPVDHAKSFLNFLRAKEFLVYILTARPVESMAITKQWLTSNRLLHDGVIYGDDKHNTIISSFPHLKFMVEDNRYLANLVAKWGYTVYLVSNQYNQGELHPNVVRVTDLMQITLNIKDRMEAGTL